MLCLETVDNIWWKPVSTYAIYKPWTRLFNLSISTATVPQHWKSASIRPLPKVSAPTGQSDFRPISITPVLSRIMKRTVLHHFLYPALLNPTQSFLNCSNDSRCSESGRLFHARQWWCGRWSWSVECTVQPVEKLMTIAASALTPGRRLAAVVRTDTAVLSC